MLRQYQAPEFRVRDTREYQQTQVAAADTRVSPPLIVGDDSWRDKMLEQFGSNAASMLNKMADIEFSNLYLEGQAKAGVIESEEELQAARVNSGSAMARPLSSLLSCMLFP